MSDARILTRRGYALLALGVVAFLVYGSLVPFEFVWRPWSQTLGSFEWVLNHRLGVASRSDALANFLIGVPLGFTLLGACRVDRVGLKSSLLTAIGVWVFCLLISFTVEFLQLYTPHRTSSSNDILFQSLGAILGLGGWLAAGQRITDFLRQTAGTSTLNNRCGRLALGYLLVVAIIQLLPMDFSLSPVPAYRRIRDGEATLVPFGELLPGRAASGAPPDSTRWNHLRSWIEVFGLYLPCGVILSRLRMRFIRVLVFSIGLAFTLEALQLTVSRHPSVTDAIFGVSGLGTGWIVARRIRTISPETGLILGQIWFAILAVRSWQPFHFQAPSLAKVNWVPLADLTGRDFIWSLEALLLRVVMYLPFGILMGAVSGFARGRLLLALGTGGLMAMMLETGQTLIPNRYPSTSEIVFAGVGVAIGAWVTNRLRHPETSA